MAFSQSHLQLIIINNNVIIGNCLYLRVLYKLCYGSDVKRFSALWFAILTIKPRPILRLANNCHDPQFSISVSVVLNGYYCDTWKFISFFSGKNGNLQTPDRFPI
jgi:hypothetical protein